jgi:Glycine-zipper domain
MLKLSTSLMAVSALALALGGCASTGPAAPTVGVMPAKGKSYEAFQRDDDYCQAAAQRQVGYRSPGEASNTSAVQSAAVGTALGALAGAAIGSASANMGKGAAIGAGTGLLAGALVGSSNANRAGGAVQDRYDMAYAQCMKARGNLVEMDAPAPVREVVVYERPRPVYVEPVPVYRPYYYRPRYY